MHTFYRNTLDAIEYVRLIFFIESITFAQIVVVHNVSLIIILTGITFLFDVGDWYLPNVICF